jgi:hypothetical protein
VGGGRRKLEPRKVSACLFVFLLSVWRRVSLCEQTHRPVVRQQCQQVLVLELPASALDEPTSLAAAMHPLAPQASLTRAAVSL